MITFRIAWPCAGDGSFKFLPYQLLMFGYCPNMVATGNGGLGLDPGEGAGGTAPTSKEGSRRANYPIPTRGGSDNKYRCRILLGLAIGMSTIFSLNEEQLEGKSGASSRGNTSSNSVY